MDKSYERLLEAYAVTKKYLKQQIDLGFDRLYLSKDKEKEEEENFSDSVEGDLQKFYQRIKDCKKCPLHVTRTNFVFGEGSGKSRILFVGEAPGREEDIQGKPFVGQAGKLLDKILKAIDFSREEVYIANVLKCRPPGNRDPQPDEIKACEPYLLKQIEILKPEIICALGRISAQALMKTKSPLGQLRGRFHDYHGIKLIVTYHPAALLRYPQYKKGCWEDVQMLRREYDKVFK
ncbi:MAG: hypothetical protein AMJ90_05270 [candidate division Zixibacteria bacterium SM23_73_2]|nr:MAG: hypothetical protein AMJ90_05270 [candidate division Zixibacteria bacterium SM23_73_2]